MFLRSFPLFILLIFIQAGIQDSFAADLWIVSTRHTDLPSAESPFEIDFSQLGFKQLQENKEQNSTTFEWKDSTAEEFAATHKPEKPLIIVIHGNWMTYPEIFPYAKQFKQLAGSYSDNYRDNYGKNYTDCRLVFLSWNSDRTNLPIRKDTLLKGRRADEQARILASCLLHLPENSKVSLVGFSFGAKLICQTLQQLATVEEITGGKVGKPKLRLRAVLLAAAMEQSSLLPNRRYGNALDIAESMLIHINSEDETLCWYPLLTGIGGPKALGKEGAFTGGISAENRGKITTKNVAGIIGSGHGFTLSLRALLTVRGDFPQYCLFE
jgi:dienelactone hydrolase